MRVTTILLVLLLAYDVSAAQTPLADPLPDLPFGPHVVRLETVAEGLVFPTNVAAVPDGSGRLFVTEVNGVVRVIDGDVLLPAPFLDISDDYHGSNGSAMSGIAFHPDFAVNRRLYVIMTELEDPALADFGESLGVAQQSVLYEFRAQADHPDPAANLADPASRRELLRINELSTIHNLDDLAFGPDGYLYASKGDDESGGQDTTTIHGTVLRIDVDFGAGNEPSANGQYAIPADNPFVGDGGGVVEEIFAYGFRNPWRLAFDGVSGDLWVADVGEGDIEEVDRVVGGANHGWDHKQGAFAHLADGVSDDLGGLPPGPFVDPVGQYDHGQNDRSITGGRLYRGTLLPELAGRYVFGDWVSGRLFEMDARSGQITRIAVDPEGALVNGQTSGPPQEGIISISVGGDGELLLVVTQRNTTATGRILRVASRAWTDLGSALAGAHGPPMLTGSGPLEGGAPLSIGLTGALEQAPAWLVVGFVALNAPFMGGTMVPDVSPPNGLTVLLATDGAGKIVIDETWPPGVPSGFELYLQFWVEDPGGVFGFAASNAVLGITP